MLSVIVSLLCGRIIQYVASAVCAVALDIFDTVPLTQP